MRDHGLSLTIFVLLYHSFVSFLFVLPFLSLINFTIYVKVICLDLLGINAKVEALKQS